MAAACEACAAFERGGLASGLYIDGCRECEIRRLARSFAFHVWRARGSTPRGPKELVKALRIAGARTKLDPGELLKRAAAFDVAHKDDA